MGDQPLNMLRYWTEKKGIKSGLLDYYPGLIETNKLIRIAFGNLIVAECALEAEINRLTEEASDECLS